MSDARIVTIPGSINKSLPPKTHCATPLPPPSITRQHSPARYSLCPLCGAQSYLWRNVYLCSEVVHCASVTPIRAAERTTPLDAYPETS
jgi:hypothetical protein